MGLKQSRFAYVQKYFDEQQDEEFKCEKCGCKYKAKPIDLFLYSHKACTNCTITGFNRHALVSTLYILQSKDFIKIGITKNKSNPRFNTLKKNTPFEFMIKSKLSLSGEIASKEEKRLHALLKQHNAGLKGFDGATEWFHANLEVMTEVNRTINEHSKEIS